MDPSLVAKYEQELAIAAQTALPEEGGEDW